MLNLKACGMDRLAASKHLRMNCFTLVFCREHSIFAKHLAGKRSRVMRGILPENNFCLNSPLRTTSKKLICSASFAILNRRSADPVMPHSQLRAVRLGNRFQKKMTITIIFILGFGAFRHSAKHSLVHSHARSIQVRF